jgi:hypothetical protein
MDRTRSVRDRTALTVGHATGSVQWPQHRYTEVPGVHVARLVAAQVREVAFAAGVPTRPLGVWEVAKLGGFELLDTDLGVGRGGYRGLLQAVRGGFRICVDARPPTGRAADAPTLRRRMRFVAAHEIGHSFFFDRRPMRPDRLLPIGSREEELFCNEFACALLLPPEVVRATQPSPEAALRMSAEWDVSLEVAVRALAEWHPAKPFVALGYSRPPSLSVRLQWAGGGEVAEPARVARVLFARGAGEFSLASLRGVVLAAPERKQTVAVAVPA